MGTTKNVALHICQAIRIADVAPQLVERIAKALLGVDHKRVSGDAIYKAHPPAIHRQRVEVPTQVLIEAVANLRANDVCHRHNGVSLFVGVSLNWQVCQTANTKDFLQNFVNL